MHVVDGSSPQPLLELQAITSELELFSPSLAAKPRVIAFNKMDLPIAQLQWPAFRNALLAQNRSSSTGRQAEGTGWGQDGRETGIAALDECPVLCMSAATGEGVREVVAAAARLVERLPQDDATWQPGMRDGV